MNPAKYCSAVVLIAVIRTTGASNQESELVSAYPGLSDSGRLLQELLKERPTDLFAWIVRRSRPSGRWVLPDEPFNNAGALLLAKFRTISTSWGACCRFLTYYRNGKAGYGATNEE